MIIQAASEIMFFKKQLRGFSGSITPPITTGCLKGYKFFHAVARFNHRQSQFLQRSSSALWGVKKKCPGRPEWVNTCIRLSFYFEVCQVCEIVLPWFTNQGYQVTGSPTKSFVWFVSKRILIVPFLPVPFYLPFLPVPFLPLVPPPLHPPQIFSI